MNEATAGKLKGIRVGTKISLITTSDIRYEGILSEISRNDRTITVKSVRSYGTEGRRESLRVGTYQIITNDAPKQNKDLKNDGEVPASNEIYDCVTFQGNDLVDVTVLEMPKYMPGDRNDAAFDGQCAKPQKPAFKLTSEELEKLVPPTHLPLPKPSPKVQNIPAAPQIAPTMSHKMPGVGVDDTTSFMGNYINAHQNGVFVPEHKLNSSSGNTPTNDCWGWPLSQNGSIWRTDTSNDTLSGCGGGGGGHGNGNLMGEPHINVGNGSQFGRIPMPHQGQIHENNFVGLGEDWLGLGSKREFEDHCDFYVTENTISGIPNDLAKSMVADLWSNYPLDDRDTPTPTDTVWSAFGTATDTSEIDSSGDNEYKNDSDTLLPKFFSADAKPFVPLGYSFFPGNCDDKEEANEPSHDVEFGAPFNTPNHAPKMEYQGGAPLELAVAPNKEIEEKPKGWTCQTCTLRNDDPLMLECAACGSHKDETLLWKMAEFPPLA